jgi:hypothetical protein
MYVKLTKASEPDWCMWNWVRHLSLVWGVSGGGWAKRCLCHWESWYWGDGKKQPEENIFRGKWALWAARTRRHLRPHKTTSLILCNASTGLRLRICGNGSRHERDRGIGHRYSFANVRSLSSTSLAKKNTSRFCLWLKELSFFSKTARGWVISVSPWWQL